MQIYPATAKGPVTIAGYLDPDDITIIEVFWGAPTFVPSTIYKLEEIIKPTIDNGYYYKCINTGKTASIEPSWLDKRVTSGTAVFKAISYDIYIGPSESITGSTWSTTGSVVTSSPAFDSERTSIVIQSIPNILPSFDLTNQITKSNGEKLTRTFRYNVNQQ